jgi:ribonuclease-3
VDPESWVGESESVASVAARLGLSFANVSLLTRALTHGSFLNEHPEVQEDNERLEFLGDAVLDFIVGAWVYHRFPEMPEGDLTKMRSAIVRNDQLASFARGLALGRALRLGRGEHSSGGSRRDGLLGSVFEAVIGAIYLDAGLQAVESFVRPLLEDAREKLLTEVSDPKSRLQEWAQAQKLGAPRYHTVQSSGPDHAKEFEMEVEIGGEPYGRGKGTSKHTAEQSAAQKALERLDLNQGKT